MEQREIQILALVGITILLLLVVIVAVLFTVFMRRKNTLLLEQQEAQKRFEQEIAETQIEICFLESLHESKSQKLRLRFVKRL